MQGGQSSKPVEGGDPGTAVRFPHTGLLVVLTLLLVALLGHLTRASTSRLGPRALTHASSTTPGPVITESPPVHDTVKSLLAELDETLNEQHLAIVSASGRVDALHARVNTLIEIEQYALERSQPISETVATNLSAILEDFLQSQRDLNLLREKAVELEAAREELTSSGLMKEGGAPQVAPALSQD